MQGNVPVESFEEGDAVTDQYGQDGIAQLVGQSAAQAFARDCATADKPDVVKPRLQSLLHQTLQIARQTYQSGIGILANSRLEVRNDGYRRLTTKVGVDDSATDKIHAVTFTVYGDGKRLAEAGPLKWGMPAQPIGVDVAGIKLVELVARSAATDNEALPVTWGEAALTGR